MTQLKFSFNGTGEVAFKFTHESQAVNGYGGNAVVDWVRLALFLESKAVSEAKLEYSEAPDEYIWKFENWRDVVIAVSHFNEDEDPESGQTVFKAKMPFRELAENIVQAAELIRSDFDNSDLNIGDYVFPDLELKALKRIIEV